MKEMISFSRCPLCDGARLRVIPAPDHWIGTEVFETYRGQLKISQCRECGYIFSNPQLSQDVLGLFYQGNNYCCHRYVDPDGGLARKAHFILSCLEKYSRSSSKKLLDFGCGGGTFLAFARQAGWDVTGFDIGRVSINSCREFSLKVTDQFDALRGENFDVITLNHVFEHVADFHGLLESLKSVLAPDGIIFIEVPNPRSLRALLSPPLFVRRFGFDERYRAFPIHLSYFTKSSMATLLKKHGFRIELLSTCGMGLDELIYQQDAEEANDKPAPQTKPAVLQSRRSGNIFKMFLKNSFYGLGWGENLIAVVSLR